VKLKLDENLGRSAVEELANGIAVLRPPPRISSALLLTLVRTLVSALTKETLDGRLWIVEAGRVRIHEPSEDSGDLTSRS
jgi:hypothetical protein